MKIIVMSAFDKKAAVYLTPFFVAHVNVGIRAFANVANDVQSGIGRNPEDFSLWELGTFDDESGQFELYQQPSHVAEAAALRLGRVAHPQAVSLVDANLGEE